MKKKITGSTILLIVLRAIYWIIGLIVIYELILKIIGRSPTLVDLLLGVVLFLASAFFAFSIKFSSQLGKIGERTKNTNKLIDERTNNTHRLLYSLANDFKHHINDSTMHPK